MHISKYNSLWPTKYKDYDEVPVWKDALKLTDHDITADLKHELNYPDRLTISEVFVPAAAFVDFAA